MVEETYTIYRIYRINLECHTWLQHSDCLHCLRMDLLVVKKKRSFQVISCTVKLYRANTTFLKKKNL